MKKWLLFLTFLSGACLAQCNFIEVATGAWHSIAIRSDSTCWTWGSNYRGQLGDGTLLDRSNAIQVHGEGDIGFLEDIITVACGAFHTIALKSDGTVWTWGSNTQGQLGDGTTTSCNIPIPVLGEGGIEFLSDIIDIAGGVEYTIALKSDGTVWGWGANYNGQLGDGTTVNSTTPVQVIGEGGIGLLSEVIDIEAGNDNTIALISDSTVRTWGAGPLGDGSTTYSATPVQVLGPDGIGYMTNVVFIQNYRFDWCGSGVVV